MTELGGRHLQSFVETIPGCIRSTSSVQQDMDRRRQPVDSIGLNRVLMWVMWLRKLILDHVFLVDGMHLATLLLIGIVPSQSTRSSFLPDEGGICPWKLTLRLDTIDIDHF